MIVIFNDKEFELFSPMLMHYFPVENVMGMCFSLFFMLVLIFVHVILIKRENPLERGSPMRVEVNAIA